MPKSKASAFLSVLLVFASGAAMGAVGYRLYTVKASPPVQAAKKRNPEEYRKLMMVRLKDALKLDDQQAQQVQRVYDAEGDWFMQARKKWGAEIDRRHDDSVAKIKTTILKPEQEPLYDKWLADRDAERKRQQKQGPGPRGNDGRRPLP